MKLLNSEIYKYASQLISFSPLTKLPVRISFFLQRNIKKIIELAQEIEQTRLLIANTLGTLDENSTEKKPSYIIPLENLTEAQQQINDLFNISQEVDLHIFTLEDFENIELTYEEFSAIMFMIAENRKEDKKL